MRQKVKRIFPPVINHILQEDKSSAAPSVLLVATRNQGKLEEFSRILKMEVQGSDLKVPEVQSEDPMTVLLHKAKEAWQMNNGQPIVVEDSVLMCKSLDGMPGPFVDQFTNSIAKRQALCRMVDGQDRSVEFQVGIAIFDGNEVHYRIGRVSGVIAEKPAGTNGFGFDDIFIPDGQKGTPKTYAQMSEKEKDIYSPRRIALEALQKEPFKLGNPVYRLTEPFPVVLDALRLETLSENKKALQFAYMLEQFLDTKPDKTFTAKKRRPYVEVAYAKGQVKQYTHDKTSASIGLLLTPWDSATDLYGNPKHINSNPFGQPTFWQMGDAGTKVALAARAYEFSLMHNPEMYAHLRSLMHGEVTLSPRPNKPSPVIEHILEMRRTVSADIRRVEDLETLSTAATRELGYSRMSSDAYMSRTKSANKGLFLTSGGFVSSLFAFGGMPPVTGWRDVIVTAALSYMRSYIPRNSIFAGNLKRQVALFNQAKACIESLQLPKDIEALCIKQIGISVGVEKPKEVADMVKVMHKHGCSSVRIYTINPDPRIIETAQAIRQAAGKEMTICVGPIVDVPQARKLISSNIAANILLAGHGGGENCTSLAGGGTANALELLYEMYLDPAFNNTAIGLEGGTGDEIGAFLGMLDVISLNRRGVAGGIETGGLFVEHITGRAVQPYHGSASIVTQWLESIFKPEIASRRLNEAGRLRNVEGVLNYMNKHHSTHSIVEHIWERRMYAGRALADQNSKDLYELRRNIARNGISNHRSVTTMAAHIAAAHRVEG